MLVVPVLNLQIPANLPALLPSPCTCLAVIPVSLPQTSDRLPANPSCYSTCPKLVPIHQTSESALTLPVTMSMELPRPAALPVPVSGDPAT
jgi:hypothetical protein